MLEQLLRDLNSWNVRTRTKAIEKALSLPIESLVELANMEARQRNRQGGKSVLLVLTLLGVLLLGGLRTCNLVEIPDLPFVVIALGVLMAVLSPWKGPMGRMSLAAVFAEVDDRRVVGLALSLVASQPTNARLREYIKTGLTRQLPHLQPQDAPFLNIYQRNMLLELLCYYSYGDQPFGLAALAGLQQIGGKNEIPAVEDYLRRIHIRRDPVLEDAALTCLEAMRARVVTMEQSGTLLRASGPQTMPETLLRPASSLDVETPPEELLRPHQPPE